MQEGDVELWKGLMREAGRERTEEDEREREREKGTYLHSS